MKRPRGWWCYMTAKEIEDYARAARNAINCPPCPHCIMRAITNRAVQRSRLRQKQKGRPVRPYARKNSDPMPLQER